MSLKSLFSINKDGILIKSNLLKTPELTGEVFGLYFIGDRIIFAVAGKHESEKYLFLEINGCIRAFEK